MIDMYPLPASFEEALPIEIQALILYCLKPEDLYRLVEAFPSIVPLFIDRFKVITNDPTNPRYRSVPNVIDASKMIRHSNDVPLSKSRGVTIVECHDVTEDYFCEDFIHLIYAISSKKRNKNLPSDDKLNLKITIHGINYDESCLENSINRFLDLTNDKTVTYLNVPDVEYIADLEDTDWDPDCVEPFKSLERANINTVYDFPSHIFPKLECLELNLVDDDLVMRNEDKFPESVSFNYGMNKFTLKSWMCSKIQNLRIRCPENVRGVLELKDLNFPNLKVLEIYHKNDGHGDRAIHNVSLTNINAPQLQWFQFDSPLTDLILDNFQANDLEEITLHSRTLTTNPETPTRFPKLKKYNMN
ncbi:hypothetical protein BN7_6586 [Wickerhamomyces ciferrii]|uniref:F-box domain-containing protein n=1 Tax=Wickerhamomyces ciferrii (strain ATCC 14091 / BCRC 22168 / CBS 111 / JCM 3599 / NBRC 0793 / NRRL Y-1031 F-60-10) TaxID=1206466 RepID=K0L040_WICCF|nr:uncharacterized protein BN7_6586 [Wickerhamomyces ciferrii]CCH46979.1 hypothetical protein BN7_6586 [Wickerhamomyces ciferrii]